MAIKVYFLITGTSYPVCYNKITYLTVTKFWFILLTIYLFYITIEIVGHEFGIYLESNLWRYDDGLLNTSPVFICSSVPYNALWRFILVKLSAFCNRNHEYHVWTLLPFLAMVFVLFVSRAIPHLFSILYRW